MNNIKLRRFCCYLTDADKNLVKREYVLACCKSDAMVIMIDKYKRLIDRNNYCVTCTCDLD